MPVLTRRLPVAVALAVSLLLAGGATATTAGTSTTAPTVWSSVLLHVHLETTSDWTVVKLGGQQIAARNAAVGTGTAVTDISDGWSLRGPGSAEADLVLTASSGDLGVSVAKGYYGTARVVLSSADGVTVLDLADDRHETGQAADNSVSTSLSRAALEPAVVTDLPRGDARRLVLAFAYPWFSSYGDSRLYERPAQPRSWTSDAGVLSMTQQARAAGVDGFVLSYSGESASGAAFDRALAAAQATQGVVAPYLETAVAVQKAGFLGSKVQVVESWLRSALKRRGDSAFLRLDGVPVVFVYWMEKLTPSEWETVLYDLRAEGLRVRLVGDGSPSAYGSVSAGYHRYAVTEDEATLAGRVQGLSAKLRAEAVLDRSLVPALLVGTVSPGYDDRKLRGGRNPVVSRDGGRRYLQTWDAALSGSPDWVVVTTWNEWYEGTEIEPGTVTGSLALQQTSDRSAAWKLTP